MWKNKFQIGFVLEILSTSNKFLHCLTNDKIRNMSWLFTFVYGFPRHHLYKSLWKQIGSLPNIDNNMLLKIGDLNELSRLDEKLSGKLSENNLTSTRYNN